MRATQFDEAPNVVNEDGLRSLLRHGYVAEVVCRSDAEKRHNTWYGRWTVRAVAPDGEDKKVLVTSRNAADMREFKTLTGLVGFLHMLGFRSITIPMAEGERARHVPAEEVRKAS